MQVDRLRDELANLALPHGRLIEVAVTLRGDMREAFVTFSEPMMATMARRKMNRLIFLDHPLDVTFDLDSKGLGGLEQRDRLEQRERVEHNNDRDGGQRGYVGGGDRDRAGKALDRDERSDPLATCRLCISDLDPSVEEQDVAAVMKAYGAVESIQMRRDTAGFMPACTALVKVRALTSSVRAKRELDGSTLLRGRGGRRPRVGEDTSESRIRYNITIS